ncbi:MAG: HAMP domain-containing protein [Proteobacteria bacterium]|nr:HAMP domain-containing protein [Pseudomonadota bacterium]MBS0493990.1 HAMP domain-containing protein [Pseudomonadota bacterium]
MTRLLNRIWVRFGLWFAATTLCSIALMVGVMLAFDLLQQRDFYNNLPQAVREELDELRAGIRVNDPRMREIYSQYGDEDLLFGERWSLGIGLALCLPFGMGVGFWVSRRITQPLTSMVEVAQRVGAGDYGARAVAGRTHGEMMEMIRAFNHMIDSVQALESERRATAASISHELRTPLTVLQARLRALCDGVIAADTHEFETLLGQVEHLSRMVSDLHTLSMADAGQLSLHMQRLDLNALVSEVLEQLRPQLQESRMALDLQLPLEEGLADIRADRDRMRQIVSNLVGNAVRHAAQGGWLGVQLQAETAGDGRTWIVLTIADAGPGLPAEVRDQPFQRFAQAPGKRRREGSGLGLSIVRALTEAQGGSVHSGPSVRGGACFRLRFPQA